MSVENFIFRSTVSEWIEANDFEVLDACFRAFSISSANKLSKACEKLYPVLTGGQARYLKKNKDKISSLSAVKYILRTKNQDAINVLTEEIYSQITKTFLGFSNDKLFSNSVDERIKAFAKMLKDNGSKPAFNSKTIPIYIKLFFDDIKAADEAIAALLKDASENKDNAELDKEVEVVVTDDKDSNSKALRKKNKDLNEKNVKLKADNAILNKQNKELGLKVSDLENKIKKLTKIEEAFNDRNVEFEKQKQEYDALLVAKSEFEKDIDKKYVLREEAEKITNDYAEYKKFYDEYNEAHREPDSLPADELNFIEAVKCQAINTDMCYSTKDLVNFHIAIKSSQLVILAGASGTGKTQLPFVYANALNMSEEKGNVLFIPITPSYTEPSDILGYFKPNMNAGGDADSSVGCFMESPTELVSFLIKASKDENKNNIYFVIFDEMNLSQIEYWFSPFMSILERKEDNRSISLYSRKNTCENSKDFPSDVRIGKNVFFIGTINLDETTKDMSDRLSDRAIVINLEKNKFSEYYGEKERNANNKVAVPDMTGEKFMSFVKKNPEYINSFSKEELEFFDKLDEQIRLNNTQKGVSFRTLKTIANYLNNAEGLENYISREEALDYAIKQTVIVKINGSDNSIKTLLAEEDEPNSIIALLNNPKYKKISDFKTTKQSIEAKRNELKNYGFTR